MIDRDEIAHALVALAANGGGWVCVHGPTGDWVELAACLGEPGGEYLAILAPERTPDSPGDRLARAHAAADEAILGYQARAGFRRWLASIGVGPRSSKREMN